jgi:SET domain-containing protein
MNYLFEIGQGNAGTIDSTRKGNKMRFANYALDGVGQNMLVREMSVNGQLHLAFFAKTDLEVGTELLFDYKYKPEYRRKFVMLDSKKGDAGVPKQDEQRKNGDGRRNEKSGTEREKGKQVKQLVYCRFCGLVFKLRRSLRTHLQKAHGQE